MKAREIEINGRYYAKVSMRRVVIRITGKHPAGGWQAVNEATGRPIRIKTAARLHGAVGA